MSNYSTKQAAHAIIHHFSRGKNCQQALILMRKKVMFLMKTLGMRKRKLKMTNRQFHLRKTDRLID